MWLPFFLQPSWCQGDRNFFIYSFTSPTVFEHCSVLGLILGSRLAGMNKIWFLPWGALSPVRESATWTCNDHSSSKRATKAPAEWVSGEHRGEENRLLGNGGETGSHSCSINICWLIRGGVHSLGTAGQNVLITWRWEKHFPYSQEAHGNWQAIICVLIIPKWRNTGGSTNPTGMWSIR